MPIRSQPASVGAPPCGKPHPLDSATGVGGADGGGATVGDGVGVKVGVGVGGEGLGFTFTPIFCSRRSTPVWVASPLNHFRMVCTEKSPVSFGNISMRELRLTPAGIFWKVMLHKAVQASVISAELTDQPIGTSMTI